MISPGEPMQAIKLMQYEICNHKQQYHVSIADNPDGQTSERFTAALKRSGCVLK